jgi:hypothetical protein
LRRLPAGLKKSTGKRETRDDRTAAASQPVI